MEVEEKEKRRRSEKKGEKKKKERKKKRRRRSRSRSRSRSPASTDGRDDRRRNRNSRRSSSRGKLDDSLAAAAAASTVAAQRHISGTSAAASLSNNAEEGEGSTSRALVVVNGDPRGGGEPKEQGGGGRRRRRPRPTAGRSFASVTRGIAVATAAKKGSTVLAIEDGRAEDDGTRGNGGGSGGKGGGSSSSLGCNESNPAIPKDGREGGETEEGSATAIDFVRAYRDLVWEADAAVAAADCGSNGAAAPASSASASASSMTKPTSPENVNTTANEAEATRAYLQRQRHLNGRTRSDPHDVEAWIELANLVQPTSAVSAVSALTESTAAGGGYEEENRTKTTTTTTTTANTRSRKKEQADLERRREILKAGVRCNPDDIDIRTELLRCTERLCLLAVLDGSELDAEHGDAVRNFEVLAAEENDWWLEREEVRRAAASAAASAAAAAAGGGTDGDRVAAEKAAASASALSFDETRGVSAAAGSVRLLTKQSTIPPPPAGRGRGRGRGRGVSNLPAWMTSSPSSSSAPAAAAAAGGPSSSEPDQLQRQRRRQSAEVAGRDYDDGEVSPESFDDEGPTTAASAAAAPSRTSDLLRLHRMGLSRLPSSGPSEFDADLVRRAYRVAFRSLAKVHGGRKIGAELAVLFLDYLRVEAAMGYSERALGMVQAALELNLRRRPSSSPTMTTGQKEADRRSDEREGSFRSYWDSEFPRIGDVYPHAGWVEWEKEGTAASSSTKPKPVLDGTKNPNGGVRESRRKRRQRLKASDFFGDSVVGAVLLDPDADPAPGATKGGTMADAPTDQSVKNDKKKSLVEAYEAAAHQSQDDSGDRARPEIEGDCDQVGDILDMARSAVEAVEKQHSANDPPMPVDDEEDAQTSGGSLDVNALIRHGDVIPSNVSGASGVTQVYSFVHNRRIEISKDELSADSTRSTLRRVLRNLRQQKENQTETKRRARRKPISAPGVGLKVHIIQEDDPFLLWGTDELLTQNIFHPPLRSLVDSDAINNDPSRTVLLEDGISDMAIPFLSNFDSVQGVPSLVVACLQFLGISFPRSTLSDVLEKNSYVLGSGERLCDIGEDNIGFQRVFSGAFEHAPAPRPEFQWLDVYRQNIVDESVVVFDSKLFVPGNESQMRFVRNLLHDMVSTMEDCTLDKGAPTWSSYVQVALISFETEAAGVNIDQARSVAKGILAGTEAAKYDPRLWMAYAQLERRLTPELSAEKSNKSASKVLLSALGAVEESGFVGQYAVWWTEVCLMAVRLLLQIPIFRPTLPGLKTIYITDESRDRVLHVLCCAVEGKFTPLPKEQRSKKQRKENADTNGDKPKLVTSTRLLKCQQSLRGKLSDLKHREGETKPSRLNDFKCHPSAELFDYTSKTFCDAALSAWLHALAPANCAQSGVNFNAGVSELKEWSKEVALLAREKGQKATKACIIRMSNLMLEFSLLSACPLKPDTGPALSPSSVMRSVLMPSVVLLKRCGSMPSKSLLLAIAFAESQLSQGSDFRGYLSLCSYINCDMGVAEMAFRLAKNMLIADAEAWSFTEGATNLDGKARCSTWTREGRMQVTRALVESIDGAGYRSYPSLWSALLRLGLLGQIGSKHPVTLRPGRVFEAAKSDYERGLTRCMHSKRFWLEAFTVLRPAFGEEEMLGHFAMMEEKDLRLVKGLEDMDV